MRLQQSSGVGLKFLVLLRRVWLQGSGRKDGGKVDEGNVHVHSYVYIETELMRGLWYCLDLL